MLSATKHLILREISGSFTTVQDDIYHTYTVILFFPICVDKFLTDVNLLGLEVT